MRFLADEDLYVRTERCLRWLCELGAGAAPPPGPTHLYWRGSFARKPALAIKSFLATQDLARTPLWLWLDAERGWHGHAENRWLRPLLPFLRVLPFDAAREARDTPLAGLDVLHLAHAPKRSDLFRFLALYHHGGVYADSDMLWLRDLGALFAAFPDQELCYRWSARGDSANSAFLSLRRGGATAQALLARCAERGSCDPRVVLRFDTSADLDLLVLPCAVFDPAWPQQDGEDVLAAAPLRSFPDFFLPPAEHVRARSHRDFYPGAFAYHWHGQWRTPEHPESWFAAFEREFEAILRDKLGADTSAAGPRAAARSRGWRRVAQRLWRS